MKSYPDNFRHEKLSFKTFGPDAPAATYPNPRLLAYAMLEVYNIDYITGSALMKHQHWISHANLSLLQELDLAPTSASKVVAFIGKHVVKPDRDLIVLVKNIV